MQIAQPPQERMEGGLQRRARVAPARLLSVAALQVGAGAERPSRARDHETADLGLPVLDRVERLAETAEHVDRHRVHDFLMVELQDGDRAVEIERDVLELHGFPLALWCRLFRLAAQWGLHLDAYLIVCAALSMLVKQTT